ETFPVAFLAGDVLDGGFLAPAVPQPTSTSAPPSPPLTTITSLTALTGHVSILHISYVFHQFDDQQQIDLARAIAGLLSPLPGSMMLGSQVGKKIMGYLPGPARYPGDQGQVFAPLPESWTAMWEDIFPKGTVRVEATLRKREECYPWELLAPTPEGDDGILTWSIARLPE
ncbi:hypothetical protein DFH09DRAFT_954321, partial [Mycena vulgaris]